MGRLGNYLAAGGCLPVPRDYGEAISRRNCSHCDAFAGIQLADVPAFIVAQLAGAICAIFIAKWLLQPAVKTFSKALARVGIDLAERIAEAATHGLGQGRARKNRCPFTAQGICMIHRVRPLACRGHASYDKRACADAVRRRPRDVPVSAPHVMVRGIVQNAMQSALRDAGYAWGSYELYPALLIALKNRTCHASWAVGQDVFAPALAADVGLKEMAKTFDEINAKPDYTITGNTLSARSMTPIGNGEIAGLHFLSWCSGLGGYKRRFRLPPCLERCRDLLADDDVSSRRIS